MIVGFWNIRGVLKKNSLVDIRDFCNSNFIKVFMICEVKSQAPPSLITANQCGFQYVDFVPTLGLAGGLWLFWKDCNQSPFNLVVIHKATRFIASNITLLNENISFIIIFIYAPPKSQHKADFWDEIFEYVNSLTSPFVILGDFNEISCEQDKLGGAPFNSNRLNVMKNVLTQIPCCELPYMGSRYTWRKKRAGP